MSLKATVTCVGIGSSRRGHVQLTQLDASAFRVKVCGALRRGAPQLVKGSGVKLNLPEATLDLTVSSTGPDLEWVLFEEGHMDPERASELSRTLRHMVRSVEWEGNTLHMSNIVRTPGAMVFGPQFGSYPGASTNIAVAQALCQTGVFCTVSNGFTEVGFGKYITPSNYAFPQNLAASVRQLSVLSDVLRDDAESGYLFVMNKAMSCAIELPADRVVIQFQPREKIDMWKCWPAAARLFKDTAWDILLSKDGRRATLLTGGGRTRPWALSLSSSNAALTFTREAVGTEERESAAVAALEKHVWRFGRFHHQDGVWSLGIETVAQEVPVRAEVHMPDSQNVTIAKIQLRRASTPWLTEAESAAAWLPEEALRLLESSGGVAVRAWDGGLEVTPARGGPTAWTVHLERCRNSVMWVSLNATVVDGDARCLELAAVAKAWKCKAVWVWKVTEEGVSLVPHAREAHGVNITSADMWSTSPNRIPVHLSAPSHLIELERGGEILACARVGEGVFRDGANAHWRGASHHQLSQGTRINKVPAVVNIENVIDEKKAATALERDGARRLLPLTGDGEVDILRICAFGDDEPELLNQIAERAGVATRFTEWGHAMEIEADPSTPALESVRRSCAYLRAACVRLLASVEHVEVDETDDE